jgi:RNA polymerase sigma factor (sigma-70 family)
MSKERNRLPLFEQTILPHLDAAYNIARWIMGNEQDAEDMVQEATLRAYQYFDRYQGGNSRAWLLTIVRNTCYTWLRENRGQIQAVEFDDETPDSDPNTADPERVSLAHISSQLIQAALDKLPVEYRELIVLRELEELSYKEIAGIAGIPMGTVMSRLARARQQFKNCLARIDHEEGIHGL